MVDGTIRNFCSYECVLTYRVALFHTLDSKCRILFSPGLILLSIFLCLLTEIRPELKSRPGERDLHTQGPFCPQTRIPCQLAPAGPPGTVFSPPPESPFQSHFGAPAGPVLHSPVIPLSPRPSPGQSTCRCAAETSGGWGQ